MTRFIRNLSKPAEFVLVTVACCGFFLVGALVSLIRGRHVYEYTTLKLGGVIAFDITVAVFVFCVLSIRGWKLQDFRLRLDLGTILAGVLLGLATLAVWSMGLGLTGYVLPGLQIQARIRYAAPVWLVLGFIVVNSLFEEAFLIGYVYQALEKRGLWSAFLASAAIRASYHIYQGIAGAVSIFLLGLLFALMFLRTRHLGLPVVAHTTMNLFLFALQPN